MRRITARSTAVLAVGAGALALLPASPAAAADERGRRCDGTQVVTCVSLWFASVSEVRAHSEIRDVAGDGLDFQVRTTNLRLQYRDGTVWRDFVVNEDTDGFFDGEDVANTAQLVLRECSGQLDVRARADFTYTRTGSASETMTSGVATVVCTRSV